MRLTTELINRSPTYRANSIEAIEIDLRGHNIPDVDNMGAANTMDSIDLTDNDLTVLRNFPLSPRLLSLFCSRNRIKAIDGSLHKSLPNLRHLVLSRNNIKELGDLEPLRNLGRLSHLSLEDNPVTKKENYRLWVIWLCPSVKWLDFVHVKQRDRKQAEELFGTFEEQTELARSIRSSQHGQNSSVIAALKPNGTGDEKFLGLSEEERESRRQRLQQATSLEEIAKLEALFKVDRLPRGGTNGTLR